MRRPPWLWLALAPVLGLGIAATYLSPWRRGRYVAATPRANAIHLDPTAPRFGYAVEEGRGLVLSAEKVANPQEFNRVLLPDGRTLPLRPDRFQPGDAEGSGRDSDANFPHQGGTLLWVEADPLESDRSYLIASEAFFAPRRPLPFERVSPHRRAEASLPASCISILESRSARKLLRSWRLAQFHDRTEAYLGNLSATTRKTGLSRPRCTAAGNRYFVGLPRCPRRIPILARRRRRNDRG